jgi:hypothetical protein
MTRLRHSQSARLIHIATFGKPAPKNGSLRRRLLCLVTLTGMILGLFFLGRHWTTRILAAHWRESLKTVSDDRAEMLVASAARLGRPGIPVLVGAMASPRESVARAGRLWLDRQLRSWENLSNRESQRNVAALAEALAAELDTFSPAARLDAARIAHRLLRWRLDGNLVDRGRFTWLCDRVLRAADFKVAEPVRRSTQVLSAAAEPETQELAGPVMSSDNLPTPRRLEIPELPRVAEPRGRFGSQVGDGAAPNVVPLPSVDKKTRSGDLADAWAMQSHRLGADPAHGSALEVYPSTRERVLVPSSPDEKIPESERQGAFCDLSLSECMQRLHAPGLESLAAETELKRRGFDALRLSIARRVYDPDRRVRLQLVRDLPGIPGIGATEWLIKMAGDQDEEVRLGAISLLATVSDPAVLDRVESIARHDPAERIRAQADRLKKRRQTLQR